VNQSNHKTNKLKLNDDKTDILFIHPQISTPTHSSWRCKNCKHSRDTQHSRRHLGVTLDCNISLERHVTNISKTAYYHLNTIWRIRRYLEQGHTKQLVHTLVISRIVCCNSLLNELSAAVVEKLQRDQNCCARVILIRPKRDHATPMLLARQLLPFNSRITFKTLLLTLKYLHTYQHVSCPTCSLRPSDQVLFKQPISRTKVGDRSFSCAAPRAWNQLSLSTYVN